MPRDHYVPASVIGRFSAESAAVSRDRRVFVVRKGRKAAFAVKAEGIGFTNDLYGMSHPPVWGGDKEANLDQLINGYEPALPYALDLLCRASAVDAETWLRTLVPYVASVFERGHDFIPRFMARPSVAAAGEYNTSENANAGRIIELERLLAPICCARWVVLHKDGGEPFVLNDLGLIGTSDPSTGEVGWALPVDRDSVLGVFPKHLRPVVHYHGRKWWAIIEYRLLGAAEARGFNEAAARLATSYVIGPSREVVELLAPLVGKNSNPRALMES